MTMEQLPFPKFAGIKHQREYVTPEHLILSDISMPGLLTIPAGTTIKLHVMRDYGVVQIPKEVSQDKSTIWRY